VQTWLLFFQCIDCVFHCNINEIFFYFIEYTTLIALKCLAFVLKGEEYKLLWPEQSEFVRMAARFGAKIIPFGAVGEDDISEVS